MYELEIEHGSFLGSLLVLQVNLVAQKPVQRVTAIAIRTVVVLYSCTTTVAGKPPPHPASPQVRNLKRGVPVCATRVVQGRGTKCRNLSVDRQLPQIARTNKKLPVIQ